MPLSPRLFPSWPKRNPQRPTPVDIIKHHDSRKNIPTEELRDFLDEPTPKTLLYPRDPTLAPQLVWKGKDDQDRAPLEVPVVPIYIQEKIHPQALIEDFQERHGRDARATGGLGVPPKRQLDLFADFNGLDGFDKKIDFYQHNQHWSNRMILGDSLAVMTSLAEKEGLRGQVQTIYIDPPYCQDITPAVRLLNVSRNRLANFTACSWSPMSALQSHRPGCTPCVPPQAQKTFLDSVPFTSGLREKPA